MTRDRSSLCTSLRVLSRVMLLSALVVLASPLVAQVGPDTTVPTTLVADRVELQSDGKLVASGNVEVLQGTQRLTASSVTYDPENDSIMLAGPIVLSDGPDTIVLASSAELTTDLRDGLLQSARVVLGQQLQLATNEVNRVEGRYTQMTKVVASSCEVCAARPTPVWQIRADRVIHDSEERQLYFKNAWFDVMGVPIAFLPNLRLPDPTLDRASGFLTPSIRTTDELGWGLKVPYFITLGDHRDLTLTPYVSDNRTTTLEFRYRQSFWNGDLEAEGAVSQDNILPDDLRAYLFLDANFNLKHDFKLAFDIESVSDDDYLIDYDYSSKDRLDSGISLTRARRDEFIGVELINYESLRVNEDNRTQPFVVGDAAWVRRFEPGVIGGLASVSLVAHGHQRRSGEDVIGRDIGRVSGELDWRRDWIGPAGLVLALQGRLAMEHTEVVNDSNFPDPITRVFPTAAAELRWPFSRTEANGAHHIIEPIAQVIWTGEAKEDTPNDESTQLEFDEGNLFSLNRFPAGDATEQGLRANIGINWTRYDPNGWSMGVTVGRIYRADNLGQFDGFESLDGKASDWLTAVHLRLPNRLSLTNRALFDQDLDYTKNELRLDWQSARFDVAGSYTWLAASPAEDRPDDTNEWRLDGGWQINDRWSTDLDWRYDLTLDRSASARLGLEYRTECLTVGFSARRRFTSSLQEDPSTDFQFAVALAGIGTNDAGKRPKRPGCAL